MNGAIWVNDRDLYDFGFVVDTFTGPTDGLAMRYETGPVPGTYGVVPLAPEAEASPRELRITGHFVAASASALLAAFGNLKAWAARGMVEIRTGLAVVPAQVFHGWYQDEVGNPAAPQVLSEWGSVVLGFQCFDPLGYDVYDRALTLSASPTPIPQGTGPLSGVIRVKGITTSPLVVTKRDAAGRVTGLLTLGYSGQSFTLGANDHVVINSVARTIQKVASGVTSDAMPYLLAASEFPLVIGADECDPDASGWGTLEISSGLSTGASAEWLGARTYQ